MKRVLLCVLRMNIDATPIAYQSETEFFPVADTKVRYPVAAFYEKTLTAGDEVEAFILVKDNPKGNWKGNLETCMAEFAAVEKKTGAKINTDVIITPFKEDQKTHGDLLMKIIEKVGKDASITVDMTFGPKDQIVILFSAMNFLERFCGCRIDNIIYGQVTEFKENKPADGYICEMAPLYYISKLMNEVKCSDPDRAVEMLKILLDM